MPRFVELLHQPNVLLDRGTSGVVPGDSGHANQSQVEIKTESALLELAWQMRVVGL
jgi:hypothetical protein